MTLIISVVAKNYVVQTSDRHVTLATGRVIDGQSNKIVIYGDKSSLVSIAYTGIAFIKGKPTDERIAEWVLGSNVDTRPDGRRASVGRLESINADFDAVVKSLYQILEQYFARTHSKNWQHRFELSISGWKKRSSAWIPYAVCFMKPERTRKLITKNFGKRRGRQETFIYVSGGWKSSIPGGDKFLAEHFDSSGRERSEALDVYALRRSIEITHMLAEKTAAIGKDVNTTVLNAPKSFGAFELKMANPFSHFYYDRQTRERVYYSFTPWLIGPKIFIAPTIIVGKTRFRLGPHDISLIGGVGGSSTKLLFSPQPRPENA